MKIEWVVFCREFKHLRDQGLSIIGLLTTFGAQTLPVTMDMNLAVRFEGAAGEKADFAFTIVDQASTVLLRGRLPGVVIPHGRDIVDAGLPIRLKIATYGRFTVVIHAADGSQIKVAWFNVDPGTIN